MIKKTTLVTRRLLPNIKKDAKFVQSFAYRTAITIPYLVLYHMAVRRFEQEYTGPEILKRYLCVGWAENNSLRSAFDRANRMEVHLEPDLGPHGIKIRILLFTANNPETEFGIYTSVNDNGFERGIGSGPMKFS